MIVKGIGFSALDVEGTDHAAAGDQGKGDFRVGIGKIGVGEMNRVFAHVEGDAWISCARDIADQADLTDRQFVAPRQHPLPALGRSRAQHGIIARFVDQKHARVVIAETFFNPLDDLVDQLVHFLQAGGVLCHISGCLKLVRPALKILRAVRDPILKPSHELSQPLGHRIERAGQDPKFVLGIDLGFRV